MKIINEIEKNLENDEHILFSSNLHKCELHSSLIVGISLVFLGFLVSKINGPIYLIGYGLIISSIIAMYITISDYLNMNIFITDKRLIILSRVFKTKVTLINLKDIKTIEKEDDFFSRKFNTFSIVLNITKIENKNTFNKIIESIGKIINTEDDRDDRIVIGALNTPNNFYNVIKMIEKVKK